MSDSPSLDFIRAKIHKDLEAGNVSQVITRFPPEPNGYLHIGHAKSICLNFGIAKEFNGLCRLRFDDTNPSKEDQEYVDSIIEDVRWLGWQWEGEPRYASDYFDQMVVWAKELIASGDAYVDDQDAETIRLNRGTATTAGVNSPFRQRPIQENLDRFEAMLSGELPEGACVLRAKIDMAHANLLMRDPLMYRIVHASHHRTGSKWKAYPLYDWAHGLEDSLEAVTHSICTLEFETHRPLYDWYLEKLGIHHPQQIEFNRLNLNYTMMSKRKLLNMVEEGYVSGWNDPRMPTISGMRRRGYSPEAIRSFCEQIGVTKVNGMIEMSKLENCLRDDLNHRALRVMAVLNPLKVVIENYPEGQMEELEAVNNPEDANCGVRKVPFARELYIEREDFMEDAPKKFFRLSVGREVRLRYAYYITCTGMVKNEQGEVVELRCQYDPETKGGQSADGRKIKATLHWVSAKHALEAEVRLYDHLFSEPNPGLDAEVSLRDQLNPDSLSVLSKAKLEPSLKNAVVGQYYQFERMGYFCKDAIDGSALEPVFNRTCTLKDSYNKAAN